MAGTGTTFAVSATTNASTATVITASGVCSIQGNTVTITATSGICSLTANWAADSNYSAASATQRTTATLDQQQVTFTGAPATAAYGTIFAVSASSTSGILPTITASGACSITGTSVTMISGTGTCGLSANWPANSTWATASASQSTAATLASPLITFTGAPGMAGTGATFAVSATTNASTAAVITASGVCSIQGNTVTVTATSGICTLTANWAADSNYSAASATQHTTATQDQQQVTFTGAPAIAAYGTIFAVSASSSSGIVPAITASGACLITGTSVTMTSGTGTCHLSANWAGNSTYAAASATQSTVATLATQTLSFNPALPANASFGASFVVFASATSGLPVVTSASGSCTLSTGVATMISGAGTCMLNAIQAGNGNYAAASAAGSVAAKKAVPSIVWAPPAPIVYGTALTAAQLNASASVPGTLVYSPASGTVLTPGMQALSVAFTPSDSLDFTGTLASVTINVTFTSSVPSSGNGCNGAYNGTFVGNLRISSGQLCTFYGGGVTGNIEQTGGVLTMVGSRVGGELHVQGGGSFSVTAGTVIAGGLHVENLPASTRQNLICGTTIELDAHYEYSAAPVEFGATSGCAGNNIEGNLQVQYNTAAASIYGNQVNGTVTVENDTAPTMVFLNNISQSLACSGNAALTGGKNTAQQKQGQCTTF
jgi:hypothetical protein